MNDRASELQQTYKQRFSAGVNYRRALWAMLCRCFFQPLIGMDKNILDLGSGWGEFINNIQGRKLYAMDLNPDGGARVSAGVHFLRQDCACDWPLRDNELDVVFTSNFLEHLPDRNAINRTLAQAQRCLKPGGNIICLGPNIKYTGGAYWDFYDHCIPLTHLSLTEALRLAGFNIVKTVPRFLPFTMSSGRPPPIVMARMYLHASFLWPLFGRQFLVVGEKQDS